MKILNFDKLKKKFSIFVLKNYIHNDLHQDITIQNYEIIIIVIITFNSTSNSL